MDAAGHRFSSGADAGDGGDFGADEMNDQTRRREDGVNDTLTNTHRGKQTDR